MKIYKLPQLAEMSPEGSFFLGPEELHSGAVYLLYGRLRPKESSKKFTPREGHEEIVCVIKGNLKIKCGKSSFSVGTGEAFHCKEAQTFLVDNLDDEEAIFIAAGGPSKIPEAVKPQEEQKPQEEKAAEPVKEADDDFEITSDDSEEEFEGKID
ncbi:MAG: hypothetical protein HYS21_11240 [Deltaproteobacteria bacterium]|nr:hypothetical protein [Deltaproteobacteria bacterium]